MEAINIHGAIAVRVIACNIRSDCGKFRTAKENWEGAMRAWYEQARLSVRPFDEDEFKRTYYTTRFKSF